MFDTMTLTKLIGGLCGTLLVYLLGGWFAETVYAAGASSGSSHDEGESMAYVIRVEDDGDEEVVDEGPSFEEIFAMADAAEGEGLFRACAACHKLEAGENGAGPYLYGVVGRDVGTAEGFGSYSGALTEVADVWTPANLNLFLENPRGWAPGTSMGYNGMRRIEDRANLIAYLDSLDD